jgi:hypothetical protein
MIGGFTTVPWGSDGGERADPTGKTAVFSLRNKRGDGAYRLQSRLGASVVYHRDDLGPCFLGGDALVLAGNPSRACIWKPKADVWQARNDAVPEMGLVDDAHISDARFIRVETWEW